MTQLSDVLQFVLFLAQQLRFLKARLFATLRLLAVSLELWTRPSSEVAALPVRDDFDELFVYIVIFVGLSLTLLLLAAFCAGAALAWSCAHALGRQRGRVTILAEGPPRQAPLPPPRCRTPVPPLQHALNQQSGSGNVRRRPRSSPPSPKTLDFSDPEHNLAHFPVPLCSPRAAPSAVGVFGQPLEVGPSFSQDSRCRLRRIYYSP